MVFPNDQVQNALNLIRVFDKIKLNSWQVEILAGESLLSRQTEQFSVFNFIYLNFFKYQLSISLSRNLVSSIYEMIQSLNLAHLTLQSAFL